MARLPALVIVLGLMVVIVVNDGLAQSAAPSITTSPVQTTGAATRDFLDQITGQKRVALVIGNSGYEHVSQLTNPKNDASDMASMLERLGFDVTMAVDQGYQGMRIALSDFADKAQGADIATVFYAGHGIEVDKQNYLIPVDARLTTDRKVRFETIALDDVLLAVEGAKGLQVVILDACRENPFASSMQRTGASRSIGRGLARVEPEGSSVLVAFAAKEGQVAEDGDRRNSPYTTALLNTLATPGVEIGILFRQVREAVMAETNRAQQPFVYQSLGAAPIYLVPPIIERPEPEPAATPVPLTDPIARDYDLASVIDSPAAWEVFLTKHGSDEDNFHVQLARTALQKQLAVPPQVAAFPEPALPSASTAGRSDADAASTTNEETSASTGEQPPQSLEVAVLARTAEEKHPFDGRWKITVNSMSGCDKNVPRAYSINVAHGKIDERQYRLPKKGTVSADGKFSIKSTNRAGRVMNTQTGTIAGETGEGRFQGMRPSCSGIVTLVRLN